MGNSVSAQAQLDARQLRCVARLVDVFVIGALEVHERPHVHSLILLGLRFRLFDDARVPCAFGCSNPRVRACVVNAADIPMWEASVFMRVQAILGFLRRDQTWSFSFQATDSGHWRVVAHVSIRQAEHADIHLRDNVVATATVTESDSSHSHLLALDDSALRAAKRALSVLASAAHDIEKIEQVLAQERAKADDLMRMQSASETSMSETSMSETMACKYLSSVLSHADKVAAERALGHVKIAELSSLCARVLEAAVVLQYARVRYMESRMSHAK